MTKEFEDVVRFNKEVIGLKPKEFLNQERVMWFSNVINEELEEFIQANKIYAEAYSHSIETGEPIPEDIVYEMKADMVDAIMDLIYFAYGRLYEIGTTVEDFECMWNAIQNANMSKKRGNKGRGSDDDAVKPYGWKGPEAAYVEFKKHQNGTEKQLDNRLQTPYNENLKLNLIDPSFQGISNITENVNAARFNDGPGPENHKLEKALLKMSSIELEKTLKVLHTQAGVKYDNGKPNLSLVFGGFPKALLEVGAIGTFGAKKYSPNGWKTVLDLQERYTSALLRHLFAIFCKEDLDNESGRLHLCHVAWNALALAEDRLDKLSDAQYAEYKCRAKAIEQRYLENQIEGQNNG